MWWAGADRARVYLGVASAGVQTGGRAAATRWVQADAPAGAFERALRSIEPGAVRRLGRRAIEVHLSGALARPFMLDAVAGMNSWPEALQVAGALAPEATGLAGPCAVWLDAWVPGQRCVAVAMEAALRDQIEQIARAARLRIATLRPWWCAAIDSARAHLLEPARLLAVEDGDSLTLLTAPDGDDYAALATHAPGPGPVQARAVLARAAMAMNLQPGDIAWASMRTLSTSAASDESIAGCLPSSLTPSVERWR